MGELNILLSKTFPFQVVLGLTPAAKHDASAFASFRQTVVIFSFKLFKKANALAPI